MTPNQIADHLVEMGIGYSENYPPSVETFYYHRDCAMPMDAEEFISKWAVAGKCLEAMAENGCSDYFGHDTLDVYLCTYRKGWGYKAIRFHGVNENPCQAICTAYCEATKDD